jgi:hypothetical protein
LPTPTVSSRTLGFPPSGLQGSLVVGRNTGVVDWPNIGRLGWSHAIALIDLILALVWLESDPDRRNRCVQQIENELHLKRGIGQSSYDGLLLAGWILQNFPERARWLARELNTSSLEERIASNTRLDVRARSILLELA